MRLLSKLMILYHSYLILIKLDIIRGFNFQNLAGGNPDQVPSDDVRNGDSHSSQLYENPPYDRRPHSTNPFLQHLYTKYYFYNKHVLKLNKNFWRYLPPQRLLNGPEPDANYFDALLSELLSSRKLDGRIARSSKFSKNRSSDGLIQELPQNGRKIGRNFDKRFVQNDGNIQHARYLSVNASGESMRQDSVEFSNAFYTRTYKNRKILHYNKYLNVYNWTDHALDDTLDDYEDEDGNGTSTAGPNTTGAAWPTASSVAPTKPVKKDPLFPPDPFTMEQKRNG